MIRAMLTQYGFEFGAMSVERIMQVEGRGTVVGVYGADRSNGVQVYVSEKGRSVRVFRKGRELK